MRIVLDTNVLISALAFPGSKPDQILHRIRRRQIELSISPFILSELDRVLREKFRFGEKEARARVRAIRSIARLFAQAVSPEERGFGMWKGKPISSLRYVNALRDADRRSAEEFLASLVSESE